MYNSRESEQAIGVILLRSYTPGAPASKRPPAKQVAFTEQFRSLEAKVGGFETAVNLIIHMG